MKLLRTCLTQLPWIKVDGRICATNLFSSLMFSSCNLVYVISLLFITIFLRHSHKSRISHALLAKLSGRHVQENTRCKANNDALRALLVLDKGYNLEAGDHLAEGKSVIHTPLFKNTTYLHEGALAAVIESSCYSVSQHCGTPSSNHLYGIRALK